MNTEYYDHIEQYLSDQLSPEEKKDFESEMEKDPDLKLVVKHYDTMMDILEVAAHEKFDRIRQSITSRGKTGFQGPALVRRLSQGILAKAATILVLIVFTFLVYSNLNYRDTAIAKYAYQLPANLTTQGGDSGSKTPIEISEDATPGERLEYAHYLISEKRYDEAASQFGFVARTGDTRFSEEAEFNLALCHLFAGDEDSARDLLTKIANNSNHNQNKRASQVLSRLDGWMRKFVFF